MIKVLHVIQGLSRGGAGRAVIATAKYLSQTAAYRHRVLSLTPADPVAVQMAQEAGIEVLSAPGTEAMRREMEQADIVHVNFWNTPELYDFLRSDLPTMRLLLWFHIGGAHAPQVITPELIRSADFALACSPYTYQREGFRSLAPEVRARKTDMVYGATDFARLGEIRRRPHATFNVGFIGTLDFIKMHPNFVPMSAAVEVPQVRFVVCGAGIVNQLKQQATELGAADRFEFRGYVEDIKSVLEELDVYGYPLRVDTYAASELNLQEAMYAGIPPVVFPHGGIKDLVVNDFTGLVVDSELEYKAAIEYLYHHPEERERLGSNARDYAQQVFGAKNAARKLAGVYERLMAEPKRARLWGLDPSSDPTDLPVSYSDLVVDPAENPGAAAFLAGLGAAAAPYETSLQEGDPEALLAAEEVIMASDPLMSSPYAGGVLHYRAYYPNDAYLRLWAGLVYLGMDQPAEAESELKAAQQLGCDHWRITWYLALAAEKAGQTSRAVDLMRNVLQVAPPFAAAPMRLSDLLAARGDVGGAVAILTEAQSHFPAQVDLLKRLAIYEHTLGKSEAAKRYLFEVRSLNPKDLDALISLGDISLGEGKLEQALDYFQEAVRTDRGDEQAQMGLSLVMRQLNDLAPSQAAGKA